MSEHSEQVQIFTWALGAGKRPGMCIRWPELELLYAVPNAAKRSDKGRIYMYKEGLRSGVPDMCLPVPRHVYHGLYIELKVDKNKPTKNQEWWLEKLEEQGYYTIARWGALDAIQTLEWYLNLPKVPSLLRGHAAKRKVVA